MTQIITTTDLISSASGVLLESGFREIENAEWNSPNSRLYESAYTIVGVVAFETFAELTASWASRQGALVEIISKHVGRTEAKAWDGYLVLLTPSIVVGGEELDAIRRDTTRLRKLIATADELKVANDVERVLRPLLPIRSAASSTTFESALSHLAEVLERKDVAREDAEAIVEAFLDQRPLMDALHKQERIG